MLSQFLLTSYRVTNVEITGTYYKIGDVIVYDIDNDVPVFGEIHDIITNKLLQCYFVLVPYIGYEFHAHINAYAVEREMNQYIICVQKEFIDHHVLSFSKQFDSPKTYVCLKYNVNCN